MLLIGLFSFLRQTMETELMMGHGDNARNRAFLFSTKMNHYREFVRDMCQCPQSGFPHFYTIQAIILDTLTVSMPSIGLSSFLRKLQQKRNSGL